MEVTAVATCRHADRNAFQNICWITRAMEVTAVATCCDLVLPHDRSRLASRRASWKLAQLYSHCECLMCDGNGGACDMTSSTNERSFARASSTVGGKSRSCSVSGNLRKCR